jgi:hypothetical protein
VEHVFDRVEKTHVDLNTDTTATDMPFWLKSMRQQDTGRHINTKASINNTPSFYWLGLRQHHNTTRYR